MSDAAPNGTTRIAILSSAGGGGGGIAASRMAAALNRRPGIEAEFLNGESFGGFLQPEVAPMHSLTNYKSTDTHYTLEHPGYMRPWMVDFLSAYDVVNIHWASYLISLAELDALARRGVKMLFMLHDFHYITGGCHYPADCSGQSLGCQNCPQFDDSRGDINFIPVNLRIKQGIFARPNVHLAAPSQWLRDKAVQSGIIPSTRAHVLRNPYLPLEPLSAQADDGVIHIVVIADSMSERRKAMPMALEALNRLAERALSELPGRELMVHFVGHAEPALQAALVSCKLPHQMHGRITEHSRLVDIFASANLVLTCSTEDNWPNILVESSAYGCLPVTGPGHGCEEFVRLYGMGAVAERHDADAFAEAMLAALNTSYSDEFRSATLARVLRDHDPDRIASHFLELTSGIA